MACETLRSMGYLQPGGGHIISGEERARLADQLGGYGTVDSGGSAPGSAGGPWCHT
jgi:hypothetical protein